MTCKRILTLEGKVCVKSNVFSSFTVFCQFSKNQEPPVSATLLAKTDTLNTHGERVQKAASDTTRANRADRMKPSVCQKNERGDDTGGEDPSGDIERNGRFNSARPTGKSQQVDGGKCIHAINGKRNKKKYPEEEVRERRPAGLGFEVVEVLRDIVSILSHQSSTQLRDHTT